MKSTRVFKLLSIALAAAVVFYFLVQGVRYLTNPYATTRVYTSTTEDAVEASGWLVREEETFRTDAGTLSPTREEGEKVGQGQVIAATYDSPGALEAVAQIQAKRLQLEQLEYALSSYLNPDAALKLDGSISDDIIALRKNLTGGDYTAASGDLSQLKAAIVKRSRAYTSSQEIKAEITAVQDEIDSLQAGLTGAANNTDEPVKGGQPRRKVGKGRANGLAQPHELMSNIRTRRQPVGRPQFQTGPQDKQIGDVRYQILFEFICPHGPPPLLVLSSGAFPLQADPQPV
mgnify:CR=1 FL=1